MAQKVASLYAEIGANTSGFKKGADDVKGGMGQMAAAMGITATIAGTTIGVIKESYDAYAKLSESVRDLALVSGTSAEESSRFIQVLDDFQLSAQDATSAARFLAKNGLSPTIETLAKLSDEFRAIKDPAEAMVFVQENLGRGGAKWVNVLNQGSAALIANSKAIEGNLILNDQQIKMYEVGRLAIDRYVDKLEGFKVSLGSSVGNVLAFVDAAIRANEIMNESTVITGRGRVSTIEFSDALEMAIAEQLQAADASMQYTESLRAQEEELKNISQINKENLSAIMQITAAYQDSAAAGSAASRQRLIDLSLEKIEMLDGMAGFSQAEQEKALAFAETAGVVEASAIREVIAIDGVSSAIANGTMKAEDMKGVLQSLTNHPWSVQVAVQMQGLENLRSTLGANAAANPGHTYNVGGRAGGGSINAGTPYMVGERGPEMIVPSSSGNVIPNNQMGGGMDMKLLARTIVSAMQQAG
jgi:hypothetical protein